MAELIDELGRRVNYLRISVTDRCNLRCHYCMPEEGIDLISSCSILSYEEILRIVDVACSLGVTRVRITGGEPLIRTGIVGFIAALNRIPKLEDIAMTTNGVLLSEMAEDLKAAGLDRINISLDTLDPDKYHRITRRDQFDRTLKGIESALSSGLHPVKINTVLMKGVNDQEIGDFIALTRRMPVHVRFIEYMPFGDLDIDHGSHYLPFDELEDTIHQSFELKPAEVESSGPARHYHLADSRGSIGFITPLSSHFCAECNRIRLTADGHLKPCLSSDKAVALRNTLRNSNQGELAARFQRCLAMKPAQHCFQAGKQTGKNPMHRIGG